MSTSASPSLRYRRQRTPDRRLHKHGNARERRHEAGTRPRTRGKRGYKHRAASGSRHRSTHSASRAQTYDRAVKVQADALAKMGDLIFCEAGICARKANLSTLEAMLYRQDETFVPGGVSIRMLSHHFT